MLECRVKHMPEISSVLLNLLVVTRSYLDFEDDNRVIRISVWYLLLMVIFINTFKFVSNM